MHGVRPQASTPGALATLQNTHNGEGKYHYTMPKQLNKNGEIKTTQIPRTRTQTQHSILQKKSNNFLSQPIIHAWCRHISNQQKRESAYSTSLVQSIQTSRVHVYTDRDMPVDIGLSLLHPLLSVGTAAAAASRRISGKGQAAAAVLLPWIGGGASFMSASQPRAPPPHHPPSAEGPRRPARHQRHQGSWVPWLWHRHRPCRWRPHLLMIVRQQTPHHRRPHHRCPEDRFPSPPPAAHPGCRWASAHLCRRGT
ncbi:hypothetical protein TcCL_NonESM12112 [Trypanosoma cruzi]|nr:hypothetical protein TcCL_NonESM12112 [Trypanosoma cruzi]